VSIALRVAALASIYLLVLTSVSPGDILVGSVIALALVVSLGSPKGRPAGEPWGRWFLGLAGLLVTTARDMALGTIRVVRFCLGAKAHPGFVEIPRGDRSRHAVALWGVLTGEAPDEYPVDVDEERHVLIVHLLGADAPDAVRERHAHARGRWQRHVVR
jgi:multicomponent Na+:H+ antiporter subunit E